MSYRKIYFANIEDQCKKKNYCKSILSAQAFHFSSYRLIVLFYFSSYRLIVLALLSIPACSAEKGICQKAYCNETTVDDVKITYAAFVRVVDKAFTPTPNTTVQVSGTSGEREKNCVDHCISVGLGHCKSVHLEPFQESNPTSECSVYSTDVYQYYPAERQALRQTKSGWVSFHVKVGAELFYQTFIKHEISKFYTRCTNHLTIYMTI